MGKFNKASDLLGLKDNQKKLTFANVCIDGADNRLFLDPLQIAGNNDVLSKKCNILINDFFKTIFNKIEKNEIIELNKLLDESGENNSIRLGKSAIEPGIYSNGKGCSGEMLYKLFTRTITQDLVKKRIIAEPMDTVLFIKGFNEDRMSDLILSIIFSELVEYTNSQVLLSKEKIKRRPAEGKKWNVETHSWETFKYQEILDFNDKPLTLVPKNFITDRYVYRTERYIKSQLMQYEQDEKYKEDIANGKKAKRINKDKLAKTVQNAYGLSGKDFIIEYTLAHPNENFIEKFRQKNNALGNYTGKLDDYELTAIIEKPYKENIS